MLLILSYLLAMILVPGLRIPELIARLGHLGMVMLGLLYVYSFTAGIATLTLLTMAGGQDPILRVAMAGFGALIGDLILSYLMREEINGEISELARERIVQMILGILPPRFKGETLKISLACLLIASPLPTELGAALLASVRRLRVREMVLIMCLLHTAGLSSILLLGTL